VLSGNEHTGTHSLPGLLKVIDDLPAHQRPKIVRGDCGFGSDTLMKPLEERQQGYLFKLKLTKNVKRHIECLFYERNWSDAGQGWKGKDGELKLSGWDSPRRVVVLRRALRHEMMITQEDETVQQLLGFIEADP